MTEENKTEITPTKFDSWRIFPRLLITLYGFAFCKNNRVVYDTADPTNDSQHLCQS